MKLKTPILIVFLIVFLILLSSITLSAGTCVSGKPSEGPDCSTMNCAGRTSATYKSGKITLANPHGLTKVQDYSKVTEMTIAGKSQKVMKVLSDSCGVDCYLCVDIKNDPNPAKKTTTTKKKIRPI